VVSVDPDLNELRDGDALALDQPGQTTFKARKRSKASVNHLAQGDEVPTYCSWFDSGEG
jgi:hypothetical protein